jgi:group I intron endonuclease
MIGIYRIKNIINNKCYYGSAKNIKRRWVLHKSALKHNRHENIYLQRAWNKYGEEKFIFEIIEECEIDKLLIVEQKYLNINPEYNIGKQANGGDNLTNHPNKTAIINKIKFKINKNIENMSPEERKRKFSRPMEKNPNWKGGSSINYCLCGKQIAPENKYCIKCLPRKGENNPFYNKKHSENTKKIMSVQRKGKYNGTQNIKFKIDNIEYFSLGDAHNKLSIPIPTILYRLKSNNPKFNNYNYIE